MKKENVTEDAKIVEEVVNNEAPLSLGEMYIGVKFEDTDNIITNVKMMCAELINILNNEVTKSSDKGVVSQMKLEMYNNTIARISDAQMNIVKTITHNS
jgi:hypothetical protein